MAGMISARRSAAAGFSLIELLVAGVITLVLGTLMVTLFAGMLSSWQQTEARTDTYRDARAGLWLLESELRTLVRQPPGELPLIAGRPGGGVAFLTRRPLRSQPGTEDGSEVCAVEYFVAPDPDDPIGATALFRTMIPSSETYEELASNSPPWETRPEPNPEAPHTEVVARNVVFFETEFLDESLTPVPGDGTAPAAYLMVHMEVLGNRPAIRYFDDAASETQKEAIRNTDAMRFSIRHNLPR